MSISANFGVSIGSSVMMMLGPFQFNINSAAYQDLRRSTEYRWPSQDRFGKRPALQYTGPGADKITLSGVIFTEYRGGTGQIDRMRAVAMTGVPQLLVDGNGRLLGMFVIGSIEETQTVFAAFGRPRKQEFTLQLSRFSDSTASDDSLFGSISSAVSSATSAVTDAVGATSALGKFVENAGNAVGGAISTMTSALDAVQETVAEIGSAVGPVIATATRGISAATHLQREISGLKNSLNNINSLNDLQSSMSGIMSAAAAASNAGSIAAGAAKSLGIEIALPSTSFSALQAVKDCEVACGKMAVATVGIYSDANSLVKSVSEVLS